MKCERCRIGKTLHVARSDGLFFRCKMAESCMFLDAVERGHPFVEVILDDGRRGVVIDQLGRGEDYIRQSLPLNMKAIETAPSGAVSF